MLSAIFDAVTGMAGAERFEAMFFYLSKNICDYCLHIKNTLPTFAPPIRNNGNENDRYHEFSNG